MTAPHVATLRDLAAVGATLRAGEAYATVELLDEVLALRAGHDLRPTLILTRPGELFEFGMPLMAAAPA